MAWHRRLLAAALTAGAVAFALSALGPAPPPVETVLAAAADLRAGTTIRRADLVELDLPPDAVPAGVLRPGQPVVGRIVAGPVRAREPLTDLRLIGPSLLDGYGKDVVAVPVRVADAAAVRLLRPGDVVDLLAAETSLSSSGVEPDSGAARAAAARAVAQRVRVLSVPFAAAPGDEAVIADEGLAEGALLVLATTPEVAADLARAAVTARLSVLLRSS